MKQTTTEYLERAGFIPTLTDDGWHVACDQCAAAVINNVPCHEHGCPNKTHECRECGSMIARGETCCEVY